MNQGRKIGAHPALNSFPLEKVGQHISALVLKEGYRNKAILKKLSQLSPFERNSLIIDEQKNIWKYGSENIRIGVARINADYTDPIVMVFDCTNMDHLAILNEVIEQIENRRFS
jgi:hypothetical protein